MSNSVLAANRLARALLADFHAMPARERNLTRWILLDPAARDLVDALLAGKDAVVGGDRATKFTVFRNRFLPERVKAAKHARMARPT